MNGLNDKQVIENRNKYGDNDIKRVKKNTFFSLLIESLSDPIIKILLIALVIKIVFLFKDFDWFETLGILIAIFLSSLISTISEYGSEKSFEKLQEESIKLKSKVKRNGKVEEILIKDVVVNDIVILEEGDIVPADGIIIEGSVSVDESTINGESKEVYKEKYIVKPNSKNQLYKGTIICSGYCVMKVSSVGENTFYGKIALELQEKSSDSPLKIRLRKLAGIISTFGYIGAALVFISFLFSKIVVENNFVMENIITTLTNYRLMIDYIIYALTLSVTIIIVSVPEGLPMMITLVLSSNMKRMVKDKVLVRRLVGIETAGSINILFTDKTGTLTTGKLKVNKIIDSNLKEYYDEDELIKNKEYYDLVKLNIINNNMSTYEGNKIIGGNSTDKCLLEFFEQGDKLEKKIKVIPFNSKNKYMITKIDHKIKNLIKGAPEILIDKCKYTYDNNLNRVRFMNKVKIKKKIEEETSKGSRVILLATSINNDEELFEELCFVSLIIINDTIRKEAYDSLNIVKDAGIQTVMITGDNKDTAISIAKELKLIESDNDLVLTSNDLSNMTDAYLKKILPNIKVIARALPQDKSRLVRISKELDLVVAMTGDGVNDAPALKKADVGFALGTGSEISKEASDIVILDNNFLSITKAILYGRTIFKSIRKFIIFQLTVNLCALMISIIGPFIGINTPVTVIQMLWINMVMDTLAGLAFSFEVPLKEYMLEKPKKKDESIINNYMFNEILITGIYSCILCIVFLKLPFIKTLFRNNHSFLSAFFGLFIFISIFNSFNARTTRINIFANIIKNKVFIFIMMFIFIVQIIMIYYGGNIFRTTPLTIKELLIIFLLSFTVIPFDMIRKILYKKSVNKDFV